MYLKWYSGFEFLSSSYLNECFNNTFYFYLGVVI